MLNQASKLSLALSSDAEKAELLSILDTIIQGGGGLLAIHHILDGAQSMGDIHTRFAQWQTDRRNSLLTQMSTNTCQETTLPGSTHWTTH